MPEFTSAKRGTAGRIGLFCVGFLALNALINVAIGQRFTRSIAALDEAEFHQLSGSLDYLIMGGSHGEDAIDPFVLGNAFNYALRGENYVLTYYKLKRIVEEDAVEIRSLILHFDYHSFSSFWRYQIRPLSFWRGYVSFPEIGYQFGEFVFPATKLVEAYLFPYAQDIDETTGLLFAGPRSAEAVRGYIPRHDNLTDSAAWRSLGRSRVEFYLGGEDPLDPALVAYFRKILALCREEDGSVISGAGRRGIAGTVLVHKVLERGDPNIMPTAVHGYTGIA